MEDVVVRTSRWKSGILALLTAPIAALMAFALWALLPHATDEWRMTLMTCLVGLTALVMGAAWFMFVAQLVQPNVLRLDRAGVTCQQWFRVRTWSWPEIAGAEVRASSRASISFVVLDLKTAGGGTRKVSLPALWEIPPRQLAPMIEAARVNAGRSGAAFVLAIENARRSEASLGLREHWATYAVLWVLLATPWTVMVWAQKDAHAHSAGPSAAARPAAAVTALYGAIAASPSKFKAASSWNYSTEERAVRRALQDCQSGSGGATDCALITVVRDTCAAYIVSPAERIAKGRQGQSQTANVNDALADCRSAGGKACELVAATCADDPSTTAPRVASR